MTDLVQRAREALEGVTEGPWATDEGGEVHKDGRVIYAWPKWNGADFDGPTERNMAFGVEARTLVPAMADRIEELEAKLAEADDFIVAQAKDHNSNNIRLAEMAHRVRELQAKLSSAVATIAELTGGKDD